MKVGAAIAEILDALPMLANYQEFRLRSVRLGEKERAIFRALRETAGDRLAAARLLGIGKTTLYRKLKQYESERPQA